ncbi:MAG TPA: tRNA pseudouridine(55) synthase TruB [Thermodesulfovibrionales bacterium]|nr:tRNA pseudouridine(55) synthase TruB [Thermodesulfovibrionales bacterium]
MNAIINLDKPRGMSSQQAVTRVKRIIRARKAGHSGTLDPIATGILLVCLGEATKVTRFLADLDKEYLALMKLGEKTDTLDAEGTVIRKTGDLSIERDDLETVLERFVGTIRQTPPMFSAIKRKGKPLYLLARKGIEVDRPERTVGVRSIEITRFDLPWAEIRVSCSKGTYIRTLCDDIGDALGVGAHVAELKRTRIGKFSIKDSVTLDRLKELVQSPEFEFGAGNGMAPWISSIDSSLSHLGEISLTGREFSVARNGLPIGLRGNTAGTETGYVRLKNPSGSLFAIGRATESSINIVRMLSIRD